MNLVDLVASDVRCLLIFFQKLYSRTIKISKIDSRDEVNEALLMMKTQLAFNKNGPN